jgi:glycosyltransferase involved in cell wall biosynthesis
MSPSQPSPVALSVVVPVLDEAANLSPLHAALCAALASFDAPWEVLFCDDGSRDGSLAVLRCLAAHDARVRVLSFRRTFGQTAALAAGFEHARGEVVVPMDADLQNDPRDIPRLLAKLDEGFDVVAGWRRERRDPYWSVTLPSRLGNALARRWTGVPLHDFGCTLTAYRREILEDVALYGEMHRFIPAWAAAVGARITELPVMHHPRRHGASKYGPSKAFRVLLDLITVRFLVTYGTRPLHFFGRLGFAGLALAAASWTWTIGKKLVWHEPLYTDPFFLAGLFLGLGGVQSVLLGLLGELTMRTYYESQGKTTYAVRERLNFHDGAAVNGDPPGSAAPRGQVAHERPAAPPPEGP